MNILDFLQEVNDALRGTDDDAPTIGTDEASYWLRTANRIRRNLYKDTSKQWRSTYQVLELGTITATATPTFDLDDTFLSASSTCYAIDVAERRHDYDIIQPQDLNTFEQQVYIAGQDPQVLTFTKEILTGDNIVGASLFLPAYVMPDDLSTTSETATVVVDDPDWLVVATAAKLAFGDLTYEDKFGDLNAEANALYGAMVKNNRRGTAGNPRKSRYELQNRLGQRHS